MTICDYWSKVTANKSIIIDIFGGFKIWYEKKENRIISTKLQRVNSALEEFIEVFPILVLDGTVQFVSSLRFVYVSQPVERRTGIKYIWVCVSVPYNFVSVFDEVMDYFVTFLYGNNTEKYAGFVVICSKVKNVSKHSVHSPFFFNFFLPRTKTYAKLQR